MEKSLISAWRTEGRLPQSLLAFSTLDLDKGQGTIPALQKNGHHYAPRQDEQYLERTSNRFFAFLFLNKDILS